MREFKMREIKETIAYAEAGGQPLHLMDHSGGRYPNAPGCFRSLPLSMSIRWANSGVLVATARAFGVRAIKVSREGQEGQHIDLCGKPLEKAKERARKEEE